jgi:hypothetical protein
VRELVQVLERAPAVVGEVLLEDAWASLEGRVQEDGEQAPPFQMLEVLEVLDLAYKA